MDAIAKLQPHRTMHLQGFDGYGCTACLHSASDTGFTIDGVWGEQSDFAVLILFDADNVFEHPRMRYLPDSKFDGMVLSFRLAMVNCVPIDSDYYKWLDWGTLNVLYGDGTTQQISLVSCATAAVGSYAQPTAVFEFTGTPVGWSDIVGLAWLDQYPNYWVVGGNTAADVAAGMAAAINAQSATSNVTASASGAQITLTYGNALGANGNRVGVYGWVYSPTGGNGAWSPAWTMFQGGTSPSAWDVSIDFSAKLSQPANVQRMWITLAPPIAAGGPFAGGAFSAVATNWAVTDANGRRPLKVAGPGSVRIEETSPWVAQSGYWEWAPADGFAFWSAGRAIRSAYSASETRKLTIETHCQSTHDIYVGTRLDGNCGKISAALDGGTAVTLDCYGAGVQVRRKLFAGVAAGQHSVVLTLTSAKNALSMGWYFYFDFLECAVASDVPDAPQVRTDTAVATDFDTDATYKMSPQRLLWAILKSGLVGEIDHYMGVFWWPARKCLTAASVWAQTTTITLSGTPVFSNTLSLILGGTTLTHVCLVGDTLSTLARAFELIVNQGSTVFQASALGNVLTLVGLAGEAQYHMAVSMPTAAGVSAVVATVNGSAVEVDWGVHETTAAPVNTAVAAWHADFFAALHAAGIGVTVSFSQELVNPPDNPPGAVWVQRFPDGAPVRTATGFGTLYSSQAAFGAAVQAYMALAYAGVAALMVAAGLTPRLQFGEVLWWYQANAAGMGFYDADTALAALAALGHALATFHTPNDDPAVNSHADANFLRARLKGYVDAVRAAVLALCGTAVFELLWPMDVDDPDTCRLMRYINLPLEWQARSGSGFDTFVCEGFQYDGIDHNVDQATRCAKYPFAELGWDEAHCRYLMGWYYSGWPWATEYRKARNAALPIVKMWAWDHLGLYGWPLPMPANGARALVF